MAKVSKDGWGTTHIDVSDDIRRARREERFTRDMGRVGSSTQRDMSRNATAGMGAAAGVGLGLGAAGVAAATNLRFRYKMQAFLHFPFAFLVSFGALALCASLIFVRSGANDQAMVMAVAISMVLAVPISIIWSIVYIQKRTKPKLRALR